MVSQHFLMLWRERWLYIFRHIRRPPRKSIQKTSGRLQWSCPLPYVGCISNDLCVAASLVGLPGWSILNSGFLFNKRSPPMGSRDLAVYLCQRFLSTGCPPYIRWHWCQAPSYLLFSHHRHVLPQVHPAHTQREWNYPSGVYARSFVWASIRPKSQGCVYLHARGAQHGQHDQHSWRQ